MQQSVQEHIQLSWVLKHRHVVTQPVKGDFESVETVIELSILGVKALIIDKNHKQTSTGTSVIIVSLRYYSFY